MEVTRRILVLIFILSLVFLFTYPAVLNPNEKIYGFARFPGDTIAVLYQIWWFKYGMEFTENINKIPILNWPRGLDVGNIPRAPVLEHCMQFLTVFFEEGFIYNLIVWAGLLTGVFAMYFLVFHLTKNRLAGLVSGLIFSFNPDHIMHSAQHLGLTLILWIPLYIYSLFRLFEKPGYKGIFLCGGLFSLAVLSNYYYGYFMVIATAVLIIIKLINQGFVLSEVKRLCFAFGFAFLIIGGFVCPIVFRFIGSGGSGGSLYVQPFRDLMKYAARWWDYFLPNEFHPVFGRFTQGFSRHYFERSLYIGHIPLVLSTIGVIKWRRLDREGYAIPFFLVSAIVFFVFSLSPIFEIGSIKVPNFSFFVYKIVPMFRVYARMGIMVILSIGVLAGYGLKYLWERAKRRWMRIFIFLSIPGILFEYINFPPFHTIDLSNIPGVYKWLEKQPQGVVIAEYPFMRNIEVQQYKYQFYQRIHRKPLINGAPEGTLGDAFRRQMQYPQSEDTAKLLACLGTDYMVVHKDFYSEKDMKEIDKNTGLKFIVDFPDARVYKVIAKPDSLNIVYWQSFGSWEKWDDGGYWRWMGNDATIWVSTDKSKVVDIRFKILAFARDRELRVYINDVLIKKIDVTAPLNSESAQVVKLENILLQPGENIVRFHTSQGENRIGDVLRNNDDRRVSFAISGFKLR